MNGFFIWAHRGASGSAPENTMAAFRGAEGIADGIELDVQLSRDGVPVVIHDATLDRTTDGAGPVERLLQRELRQLDAGSWFAPAFAGERVPTLEEVLAWVGGRLRLNLEVKAAGAGNAVLELLGAYPQARVVVSSFDQALLERLRAVAPALPLAFVTETRFWRRAARRAAACGAESLNPRQDRVSPALVTACRRLGLRVYPWTVDAPERLGRLVELEVDGAFTNVPAVLARCLRRR